MQIDKNKYYSLSEIAKAQVIPKPNSYPSLHAEVLRDAAKPAKDRVLDAVIMGNGRGTIIRIKGQNLLDFIETRK